MISLQARPVLAPSYAPAPTPPRTSCAAPVTRDEFLHAWRADQIKTLRISEHVSAEYGAGFTIDGRPYVARRYHLADGRTGWTMVHDEASAIAYFDRLFGAPRQGSLPL